MSNDIEHPESQIFVEWRYVERGIAPEKKKSMAEVLVD
jgi:hypothetical protein